jgi:hypothetical protein
MGTASTVLLSLFVGVFGIYLIATEFLDTIGRLEIIEHRWPRLWAAMSNRPMRLILLVLLIGLVAKDIAERLEQKTPPPLRVTVQPPAPPTIQMVMPDARTSNPRLGTSHQTAKQIGNGNQANPVTVYGKQQTNGTDSPIINGSNDTTNKPPK